ncbi:MAG: type II toxin-antitoxin system HicA family toxin [Methanothrix sp.]|nr:type II toxin-antitoxin system HicA family toxin [Methanothrix sp.]
MSNKLVPVSRRELIRRLGDLGFHGPCAGSGHDFMVKGDIRVTIPNTHQGKEIGVRLLTQVLKEAGIGRMDWLQAT